MARTRFGAYVGGVLMPKRQASADLMHHLSAPQPVVHNKAMTGLWSELQFR